MLFRSLNSTNRNVIACRYDLTYPADMNVRYRTYNTQDQVEITEMPDKKKKLSLKMINVQPVSPEPLSDIKMNGFPSLHVYPDIFYYNGKRCDASSWESLGKWQYESLNGLDALPEDIKRKVRQLTDSCSSDLSKVKVLYEFMNSTTRYVSIQLGIGGYIPFSASEVAKKGFGDCKALSNYMKALLKEADVFSEYCIVKSGATEVLEKDFVNFTTFNHAILKVPLPEKDIWLECTANIPVGYIHNGISGQDVLVVGKNGGRIENIGVYDVAENVIYNTGLLKIDSSGNGSFEYSSQSALHNGHQLRSLLYADMNKKNNYVISALRHSNTRLDAVSITETREEIPVVDIVASALGRKSLV